MVSDDASPVAPWLTEALGQTLRSHQGHALLVHGAAGDGSWDFAAALGQGVALASLFLAGDALAAGTLVRPFAAAVGSGRAWYALSSADRLDDGDVRDVWSWLSQQAAEMETDQPVPRHDGR